MKPFTTFAVIAVSLLAITSCKPKLDVPTQNPTVQDDASTPNSQLNANASTASESQAQVDEPQQEPSVAQNPSDEMNAQAKEALPSESMEIKEYVDIADWCRPGMTEPITAQEWAKANNAFGLKFLRETTGNTVFSPYSIERALGMTLDGACGTTASEMLAALEMPNAKRLSLAGRDVDDAMKSVNKNTMLEIDNALWPDKSLTLPKDFLARISTGYRNKTVVLDYRANPEKARVTINDDIAKTTHDKITDLIPPGSISNNTRLVLTNAVYFKSKWKHPFDKNDTQTEKFYNSTKQIKTKIMHQTGEESRVCLAKDYAIYDLPFKSSAEKGKKGAYVMRIVLPTINKSHPMNERMTLLESVEKQLSGDIVSNCHYEAFDHVYVAMPKFKLTPDAIFIAKILQSMGMRKAYSEDAEFYAMPNKTPQPSDPSSYLKIDDVLHKAFIEIDEKGAEAAAATAVSMGPKAAAIKEYKDYYFTADHPFIYMIIEQSTGAAIFMGRVTDL
ncbi:MAG: serpin family protein [Proteobacteria bacterium]|nr:serpin family protein [Pseudomonadota bacterium]